jgi:hypothetical protein
MHYTRLFVSSKDKSSGTHSDFKIDYPNEDLMITSFRLKKVVIPKLWNNVNTHTSSFSIIYNAVTYSTSITEGIYTSVVTLMDAVKDACNTITGTSDFSASYNSTTGKITFTTILQTHGFQFANNELADLLGFEQTNQTPALLQASTKRATLEFAPVIYIQIAELAMPALSSSEYVSHYLGAVTSIQNSYGTSIVQDYAEDEQKTSNYQTKHINMLSVRLVDDKGRALPLNHPWYFELEIF